MKIETCVDIIFTKAWIKEVSVTPVMSQILSLVFFLLPSF